MKQGRPKKLNAEYFPHYSIESKDERIFMLIKKFGAQGYGIYWFIKEELASKDYFIWEVKEGLKLESFCSSKFITKEKFFDVLNRCVELELFDKEAFQQNFVFSHELVYSLHKSNLFYYREVKLVDIYKYLESNKIKIDEKKKFDILEKCKIFSDTAEQGSIVKEKKRKENEDYIFLPHSPQENKLVANAKRILGELN